MRVLYIYCHPLPESFHAAIREEALAYHALYHLNVASEQKRIAFIARVRRAMERIPA